MGITKLDHQQNTNIRKNALNIIGETEDCQKNWLQQINITKKILIQILEYYH
jgi:hypothetical protein